MWIYVSTRNTYVNKGLLDDDHPGGHLDGDREVAGELHLGIRGWRPAQAALMPACSGLPVQAVQYAIKQAAQAKMLT